MDDVPTAQPALALTHKVLERVTAAGLPADLLPDGLASIGTAFGSDPENALRTQALEFMDTVRKVERNVIASRRNPEVPAELDDAQLGVVTEEEWRAHWPTEEQLTDEPAEDPEPVVDEVDPEPADDQDSSVEPQ
jgi:XTP/dITP diphosphohydrolase